MAAVACDKLRAAAMPETVEMGAVFRVVRTDEIRGAPYRIELEVEDELTLVMYAPRLLTGRGTTPVSVGSASCFFGSKDDLVEEWPARVLKHGPNMVDVLVEATPPRRYNAVMGKGAPGANGLMAGVLRCEMEFGECADSSRDETLWVRDTPVLIRRTGGAQRHPYQPGSLRNVGGYARRTHYAISVGNKVVGEVDVLYPRDVADGLLDGAGLEARLAWLATRPEGCLAIAGTFGDVLDAAALRDKPDAPGLLATLLGRSSPQVVFAGGVRDCDRLVAGLADVLARRVAVREAAPTVVNEDAVFAERVAALVADQPGRFEVGAIAAAMPGVNPLRIRRALTAMVDAGSLVWAEPKRRRMFVRPGSESNEGAA